MSSSFTMNLEHECDFCMFDNSRMVERWGLRHRYSCFAVRISRNKRKKILFATRTEERVPC